MSSNSSPLVKVNVSGRLFVVPKIVLEKCDYFKLIFEGKEYRDDEEIYVPKSSSKFECILDYLYDDLTNEYSQTFTPLSNECIIDMKFYAFDYPKYTVNSEKVVTIDCSGILFKDRCCVICEGSQYLKDKILNLFVGETLYLTKDVTDFEHVIGRVRSDKYFIPFSHRHLKEEYGLKSLDLTSEIHIDMLISGHNYKMNVFMLLKIPKLKAQLEKYESIRPILCNIKAFNCLMLYIINNDTIVLEKYKTMFEFYNITPHAYHRKVYNRCCYGSANIQCPNIVSLLVYGNDRLSYSDDSDFCH